MFLEIQPKKETATNVAHPSPPLPGVHCYSFFQMLTMSMYCPYINVSFSNLWSVVKITMAGVGEGSIHFKAMYLSAKILCRWV